MENLEFTFRLKSANPNKPNEKTRLVYLIALNKAFDGHRFLMSTGEKVKAKGFDPSRPGVVLKRFKEIAEKAYASLKQGGSPINNVSLKARIELIHSRYLMPSDDKSPLAIWVNNAVAYHVIPDEINKKDLAKEIQKELAKPNPNIKGLIDGVLSKGANTLFGFWEGVLSGTVKVRSGKPIRSSTIVAKRQTLKIVKEFRPSASFDTMDRKFYNDFCEWMKARKQQIKHRDSKNGKVIMVEKIGLDQNTIGRHIKELKSILHLATANELMTDTRFTYWPVTKLKNEVVALTKDDIVKINSVQISGTRDDVRDIFVLACFLGARIGDFKQFKKESLTTEAGITYFNYVAGKTGSRVKLPVHPIALKILEKRNGEFPQMIAEQNFRSYLKEICAKAELNDRVVTKIRDGKPEYSKKCEAISPHSSRRTFASALYYGWFTNKPMPASLCMRYTGHKSESSFLLYIGADSKSLDSKALEYFDVKPQMNVS